MPDLPGLINKSSQKHHPLIKLYYFLKYFTNQSKGVFENLSDPVHVGDKCGLIYTTSLANSMQFGPGRAGGGG